MLTRNNPAGWFTNNIACTPGAGATIDLPNRRATIAIGDGEAVTCVFTVDRSVSITARVFNDLVRNNANLGRRNAGDPWLAGWTMTLSTSPTTTISSGATTGTTTPGLYEIAFRYLRAGSYTVCETLQAGWTNSAPGSIDPTYGQPCKSITLTPGQGGVLLFGNYQATTVAGEINAAAEESVTDSDQIDDLPVSSDEEEKLTN